MKCKNCKVEIKKHKNIKSKFVWLHKWNKDSWSTMAKNGCVNPEPVKECEQK